MRGRLIRPFLVEIEQLDTAQTQAAGGYDPVMRTVRTEYGPDGQRVKGARYKAPIRLEAQIEDRTHRMQQQTPSGNLPRSNYVLVSHFTELEQRGFLTDKGEPTIKVNDRLIAIYDVAEQLVQTFEPKLYMTEARTSGFGIGSARNLFIMTFADRPQGAT